MSLEEQPPSTTLLLSTASSAEEAQFVELINAERAGHGLEPLRAHWDLVDDARAQSEWMAAEGFIFHNPNLASVTSGYDSLGENVGVGGSVESLHEAFMNSPGHRANILGSYNYLGIGIRREGPTMFVTEVFMRGPVGLFEASGAPPCPEGASCDSMGLVTPGARFILFDDLSAAGSSTYFFGNPGDVPIMGDWTCNGEKTPGMFRPQNGFIYLRDTNTQGIADREFYLGNPGDIPLVGDWNGDGCDTVSLYRPSEGKVYIKNSLSTGTADYDYYFGNPKDKPFAGDWDGDGIDTVGLHRESTGFVYLRNSNTQGIADASFYYGDPGDRITAGDWDGDGIDTVAIYRPSNETFYLRNSNSQGVADYWIRVGPFLSPLAAQRL